MGENKQQNIEHIKVVIDQTDTRDIEVTDIETNEEHHHYHHHHHHHHSSHHHKHRRRHHSSKSSSKKKNNNFLPFIKKNSGILISVISCTVSVVLIVIMALNIDSSKSNETNNNYTDMTKSTIKIETSVYSEKISLVNDAISYYVDPDNGDSAYDVYRSFNGYETELNLGLPVSFTYRVTGLPGDMEVQSGVLEIAENSEYKDALDYKLDLEESIQHIYNLKTGTKYYYRVNVTLDNDVVVGTTGTFETEKSPRILNIDGVANVRDIGGWNTTDGGTVRQGLVYRGSEMDGTVKSENKITDLGIQQIVDELGVKFDMDLRTKLKNNTDTGILGENVAHKYYDVGTYSNIFDNKEQVREIFSDLANPDNYPIYLHCSHGRDKTGTVCYLLEALLGVSDGDLVKEYELSAFTDSYVNIGEFNAFVDEVGTFDGATTQEKVEGYLLSVGVTAEEIETIRGILLEEK